MAMSRPTTRSTASGAAPALRLGALEPLALLGLGCCSFSSVSATAASALSLGSACSVSCALFSSSWCKRIKQGEKRAGHAWPSAREGTRATCAWQAEALQARLVCHGRDSKAPPRLLTYRGIVVPQPLKVHVKDGGHGHRSAHDDNGRQSQHQSNHDAGKVDGGQGVEDNKDALRRQAWGGVGVGVGLGAVVLKLTESTGLRCVLVQG